MAYHSSSQGRISRNVRSYTEPSSSISRKGHWSFCGAHSLKGSYSKNWISVIAPQYNLGILGKNAWNASLCYYESILYSRTRFPVHNVGVTVLFHIFVNRRLSFPHYFCLSTIKATIPNDLEACHGMIKSTSADGGHICCCWNWSIYFCEHNIVFNIIAVSKRTDAQHEPLDQQLLVESLDSVLVAWMTANSYYNSKLTFLYFTYFFTPLV